MLQAQLERKLTRDEENMEDLLVSNVFGSLKYLNPNEALLPVLRSAESIDGDQPLCKLSKITDIHYEFWQWIQEGYCNGCQPDVLITFECPNGKVILLVEAKYLSGKSSVADEGPAPNDQLAKEFDNLEERARRENATPKLLYITAGFGYPTEEIEESKKEYLQKRGKQLEILWLSWRKIPRLLKTSEKDSLLYDLSEVLKIQGLLFFEGITRPKLYEINWRFNFEKSHHWDWSHELRPFLWSYR